LRETAGKSLVNPKPSSPVDENLIASLKRAHREHPEALFSLFTTAGHVISGKITELNDVITLQTGTECTIVPLARLEAFSYHDQA